MKRWFIGLLLLFCVVLLRPIGVEAADKNVHAIVICGRNMHKTSAKKIQKALKENNLPVYKTKSSNIKFLSYEVKSSKKHTTRTAFYDALDDAFSASTSKDLNIVFYTGHGAPDGIPLWMGTTNKTKAGITYKDLASKLSKYKGKFVYISNTCFSRAFYTQGVNKVNNGNKRFLVLSAVYQDLKSIENVFTDRILKGVGYDSYTSLPSDYNRDGDVSVDELYTYTDRKSVAFRPYLDGIGPGKGITIFQFAYVKQTKSRVSTTAGKSFQLKSKVYRSGDRARTVKWKSSNKSVATVSSSGKVTAKKAGKVKITAYLTDSLGQIYNGSESVCTVTVKKSKPQFVSKLRGNWQGYYYGGQGKTSLLLDIYSIKNDGTVLAVFNFSEHPDNRGVPSGSYYMKGIFDSSTNRLKLTGTSWIDRPSIGNYSFADIDGTVNFSSKIISGSTAGYSGLYIKKK